MAVVFRVGAQAPRAESPLCLRHLRGAGQDEAAYAGDCFSIEERVWARDHGPSDLCRRFCPEREQFPEGPGLGKD